MNMKNRSSLSSGAKKAPVVKRPVGSYYNSTAAATTNATTTINESVNVNVNSGVGVGVGAASNNYLYASSSVPAATSTAGTTDANTTSDNNDNDNNNDTWDDWGSPVAAKTSANVNPHSSWAAPSATSNAPVAAAAVAVAAANTNTNDWYSAGDSGSATTAPVAPGYTSSGFSNQPSSQQQQYQQQQQQQQQHQQQQQNSMQPGNGFYLYPNNATQQQQPFLSGSMDSSAPTMSAVNPNMNPGMTNANGNAVASSGMPSFSMFMPSAAMQQQQSQGGAANDSYPSIEDEAPLLEELGINIQHMVLKTKAVVFPFSRFGGDQIDPHAICQDGDLPGPVALLLLLGGEMVMAGKLQFGYIYIYGLFGCLSMTLVVNLISPTDAVSFWTVMSIMGYALLPVNILGLIKIFVINLFNMQTLGAILGGLTILWSTMASTRLLELGCDLRDQRYLIMYPLLLFYSAFVMMTIL
jgi:hypothetical protein